MIPVEGHKNLFRDETTGAILNCDSVGYQNYINTRNERKKQKDEIDQLKNDVNEIKSLLLQLINESK
jgi:hypothetical protein